MARLFVNTGVYGDHEGAWVDEDTPPGPLVNTVNAALR